MSRNISLSDEVYERLAALKESNKDSFNDVIERRLDFGTCRFAIIDCSQTGERCYDSCCSEKCIIARHTLGEKAGDE